MDGSGKVYAHGAANHGQDGESRAAADDEAYAHADRGEILKWLRGFQRPPKRTFLVHGEPEARLALEELIGRELPGWKVHRPGLHESVVLS